MKIEFNDYGFLLSLDMIATIAIGLISLFIGSKIKKVFPGLDRFGIPAVVIGGLIFAFIHLLLHVTKVGAISYNTILQGPFMLLFFATIGLNSSISALKKGGKLLLIFWLLSGFMTLMQTVIGVSIAKLIGIDPLIGVLSGSVSMSGGHGSAASFGSTVAELGVTGAQTVALSSATFGLIAGGLLGAPLAINLINKFNLKPENIINKEQINDQELTTSQEVTVNSLLAHLFVLVVLMTIGTLFSSIVKNYFGIAIPSYVAAMFCAIIFNNINLKFNFINFNRRVIVIFGEVSLTIFLAMALISLKLWELLTLAIPILIILIAQVVFMYCYARYLVFKLMGSNYDAAVIVSGICGSGLGATTNAMINMKEVNEKYGYTVTPYLIVPLTGAFLIDLFQIPVIVTAINIFS